MYKEANAALHDMMKMAVMPANICQAVFFDAKARCSSINVIRSKTKRKGPQNIRPNIDKGPCNRMIMIL